MMLLPTSLVLFSACVGLHPWPLMAGCATGDACSPTDTRNIDVSEMLLLQTASVRSQDGCSAHRADCSITKCCSESGLKCFKIENNKAKCLGRCKRKQGRPCTKLSPPVPGCSADTADCSITKCCSDSTKKCFKVENNNTQCLTRCKKRGGRPCTVLSEPTLAPSPKCTHKCITDLVYDPEQTEQEAAAKHKRVGDFCYCEEWADVAGARPAVIMAHGSGTHQTTMYKWGKYALKWGYPFFTIDYVRGCPGNVALAQKWLESKSSLILASQGVKFTVKADTLGIWGYSLGGICAAKVGLHKEYASLVKVVVTMGGIQWSGKCDNGNGDTPSYFIMSCNDKGHMQAANLKKDGVDVHFNFWEDCDHVHYRRHTNHNLTWESDLKELFAQRFAA